MTALLAERVEARLAGLGSAVIALSGGVDSSLVAAFAARALGPRALAVTAVSPALAAGELEAARRVAEAVGVAHQAIDTDELARPGYRENGRFRCFHCKSELYERLGALAAERGFAAVCSGANADDVGDWRPGLRAAAEHGVVHPLLEAGLTKEDVRALARRLGVPVAEKPASPCLSSRVPYGTAIDPSVLARIDRAETAVRALGYTQLRVRHLGDRARLELAEADLPRGQEPDERERLLAAVRGAGYTHARLSPVAFRSGSLNVERVGSGEGR